MTFENFSLIKMAWEFKIKGKTALCCFLKTLLNKYQELYILTMLLKVHTIRIWFIVVQILVREIRLKYLFILQQPDWRNLFICRQIENLFFFTPFINYKVATSPIKTFLFHNFDSMSDRGIRSRLLLQLLKT